MEQNEDLQKKLQKDSFYRQQQQRLQQLTLKKDISADDLIRNILEKVDTDAKITKFFNNQNNTTNNIINNNNNLTLKSWSQQTQINNSTRFINDLSQQQHLYNPSQTLAIPQCFFMHPEIPEIYLKIWNMVKIQTNINDNDDQSNFCDRDKLYQILILSQLSNDLLAKLWSFVNRFKPGELTRNELFVMLALIGLLQQNSLNPFNELYTLTNIPVPYFKGFQENNDIPSKYNYEHKKQNDFDPNEFCEFKSATINSSDTPTISIDATTIKPTQSTNHFQSDLAFDSRFDDNSKYSSHSFNNNSNDDNQNIYDLSNNKETIVSSLTLNNFYEKEISSNQYQEDLFDFNEATTVVEEFGDFHSQPIDNTFNNDDENYGVYCQSIINKDNQSEQKNHIDVEVGIKILTAIKQLVHKTFNILTVNHDEKSVIEALCSDEGIKFSYDLYEVFQIAQRIKTSLDNYSCYSDSRNQYTFILSEIFSNWNSIYNLLRKASINISIENEEKSNETTTTMASIEEENCRICSGSDWNTKSSILYSNFRYHISCANFWLNFVAPSLP